MDVNTVIDNLCERFGVAAEYLIPKVSQYLIVREGLEALMAFVLLIIFTFATVILFKRGLKDDKYDDLFMACSAFTAIGLVIALIFFIPALHLFLVCKFSPEVSAINYILKMVK